MKNKIIFLVSSLKNAKRMRGKNDLTNSKAKIRCFGQLRMDSIAWFKIDLKYRDRRKRILNGGINS